MFGWRHSAGSVLVVLFALFALDSNAAPPDIPMVRFPAALQAFKDLSAAAKTGEHLFVASDETPEVLVLEKEANTWSYRQRRAIALPVSVGGGEIDIEAIAADRYTIYVAGSHSIARKKVSASRSYATNRARFTQIKDEPNRDHIFRFEFNPDTGAVPVIGVISLRGLLERDPILSRFVAIPGKENGIDIEGLSVVGDDLYVGFRSPVLRHGLVPILKMRFTAPEQGELLFVDLGGRGIRDMTPVAGGFFLLAGPSGDVEGSYALFYWTGEDGLPGSDRSVSPIKQLATIDTPRGTKAEALTILQSHGLCHDILLLFDGIEGGAPRVERICLPES